MLRRLGVLVAAIVVLALLAVAVIVARQRPPAIDGSDGGAQPLAWWSRKAIQGMFDYRGWSGARSGYIAMFARDGEIVYATSAGWADVERRISMTLVPVRKRIGEARDWTPGGGGLVSTVGDYMRFGLMMRNRGSLDGVRILEPETVAEMTRPHIESGVLVGQGLEGLGWGLGMSAVVDAEKSITIDRDGDFWWAGYFGTYWWVSPQADLVGVVFAQNEPGPHSDTPFAPAVAVSLALARL